MWCGQAKEAIELLRDAVKLLRIIMLLLRDILRVLIHQQGNRVTGGVMSRIGDTMNPIQPGQNVKFQVTPTFSGAPFALDPTKTAVVSSDPANFPAVLDPSDPSIIDVDIPTTASPTGGSEPITVTWTYTNTDGVVATVQGTVTETGIDDVTGGTFTQIA